LSIFSCEITIFITCFVQLLEEEEVEASVSKESASEPTKMDADEAPADAAAPPNGNDADVNMQDAKANADTPGVENGVPENGDKPGQMDVDDAKVSTIERNI
jgi:heat shock protein 4